MEKEVSPCQDPGFFLQIQILKTVPLLLDHLMLTVVPGEMKLSGSFRTL